MTSVLKVKELDALAAQIRICVKCPLHHSRTNAVPGEGKASAKIMIIGEAPGGEEDRTGRPFIGAAGKFLDHVLAGSDIERADFFITNIVKCRPEANRTPKKLEVDTCTSLYLFHQIELIQPELIVLLGSVAAKKLLGVKSVEEVRGRIVEREGRRYFVTYHPAAKFYREDLAEKIEKDFLCLKDQLQKL